MSNERDGSAPCAHVDCGATEIGGSIGALTGRNASGTPGVLKGSRQAKPSMVSTALGPAADGKQSGRCDAATAAQAGLVGMPSKRARRAVWMR